MNVYYCDISRLSVDGVKYDEFCLERKRYVDSISDKKRKLQSIAVWKLLQFALKDRKVNFIPTEYGKWCDEEGRVYVSLSHSANIVAVAISDRSVGVDVEMYSDKITKIKRRFDFIPDEKLTLTENLTKQWTVEECVFKAGKAKNLCSKKIKDKSDNEYFISACGENEDFEFISVLAESFIK